MRMSSSHTNSLPRSFGARALLAPLAILAGCTGTIGDRLLGGESGAGGAGSGAGPASGTGTGSGTGGGPSVNCLDGMIRPGRAPIRRLTRFEYSNTVRDVFGDTTSPGNALPAESIGNGFGNDADAISTPSLLAEQLNTVAEGIAARATATPAALAKLAPCGMTVTAATEDACAKAIIDTLTPKLYRRPISAGESDALIMLEKAARATPNATFAIAIASVIEAVLQSPYFLYRPEFGVPDQAQPTLKRLTSDEMATRLSFLFFGTTPDESLRAAARTGELLTADGVKTRATQMVNDARARPIVRFFFDNLLPINGLTDLERDKMLYPTFTPTIGSFMREETQRLLEFEIFDGGSGTWPGAWTAPYSFLNQPLAAYYGVTGVTSGMNFVKVNTDTTKRLGFLTQGGVMAGSTHSNLTNPVVRGSFIVQKLLCRKIPPPPPEIADQVKPPDPSSGKTARERYEAHRTLPICAGCHANMDPVGLVLENFDPVGLFRTQENGVTIDVTGNVPGGPNVNGPVELVNALAATEDSNTCFATHWLDYGYGRTMGVGDECAQASVNAAFKASGYKVKDMLVALTQTDEFLYYPGSK